MTEFIVDIEMSLTMDEITLLKKLAELQNSSIPMVARECMLQKCKELLNKNVVKANPRIKKRNVSDKTS